MEETKETQESLEQKENGPAAAPQGADRRSPVGLCYCVSGF